jgi:hypothetical protein
MPDQPDEETTETSEGNAGEAQLQPENFAMDEVDIPDSVFDARQRAMATRRKEAGPPLRGPAESDAFGFAGDDAESVPDVPPTDCDVPESEE